MHTKAKPKFFNKVTASIAAGIVILVGAGATAIATQDPDDLSTDPIEHLDVAPDTEEAVIVDEGNHVVKDDGEEAVMTDDTGDSELFTISVTDISQATQCEPRVAGDPLQAEHGTFYFVQVEAALAPLAELPEGTTEEEAFMPLLADTFQLETADGTVVEDATSESAWGCLSDDQLLPGFLGAGETVSGIVVLDAPSGATQVIYDPTHSGGWTWPVTE